MPFRIFKPILPGARFRGRLVQCLGAGLCIGLTYLLCARLPFASADLPIIVAPLGASAVLALAVPASPLAQPWPVVGGNIISALVGVAIFQAVPDIAVAAGLAVGGAILVMSLLRCLHPPGGAAALTAVIGGQGIHAAGYGLALVPIGINSIALVLLAMAFHRMTDTRYPHRPARTADTIGAAPQEPGLDQSDIDAALADMHESFDIAREDLEALLIKAEQHAVRRRRSR